MPEALGTRDRLLQAAEDLIREVGVPVLTLAAVAKRAGVSRQAVYLHFGNRASLLVAMARRMDHVSGFVGRLVGSRTLEPVPAFRRMVELWLAYLPTILPVARALEAAAVAGDDGALAYHDRMDEWRAAIRVAVARLADAGALAHAWDVDRATDWVWAQMLPSVYDHLTGSRGWSGDDVVRATWTSMEATLLA